MSIDWPIDDLTGTKFLKAEHINEGSDALQNFVNEGINTTELKSSVDFLDNEIDKRPYDKKGWVKSRDVYRPEFYGSPSPRMMATSGQTHYREVQNDWSSGVVFNAQLTGSSPVAVPNTATRIKLKHKATVNIMASFYMFEVGGVAQASSEKNLGNVNPIHAAYNGGGYSGADGDTSLNIERGYESLRAGLAALSINGELLKSTRRRIYTGAVGPKSNFSSDDVPQDEGRRYLYQQRGFLTFPMIGRHQHNILLQTHLEPGIHDIGLVFEARTMTKKPDYPLLDWYWTTERNAVYRGRGSLANRPGFPKIKHIFFLARNFIVDCYYEDNV